MATQLKRRVRTPVGPGRTKPDHDYSLPNVLRFPKEFKRGRKRKKSRSNAETIARWWLQLLKKYPNLQIELVGRIDKRWPCGKVARLLRELEPDGFCIRIFCSDENGREIRLARTRVYIVQHEGRTYHILGDTLISDALKEKESLQELLIALRIVICWIIDIPTSQIFWPAGKLADLAQRLGFVEVCLRALETAPKAIIQVAKRSKNKSRGLTKTGMLRLSDKMVPIHIRIIQRSVKENCVVLRGRPKVKIPLGPKLEAYFRIMRTKIAEERRRSRHDGKNDGC
ncbi:hypothetical protein [Bradyrhizobium sp.]